MCLSYDIKYVCGHHDVVPAPCELRDSMAVDKWGRLQFCKKFTTYFSDPARNCSSCTGLFPLTPLEQELSDHQADLPSAIAISIRNEAYFRKRVHAKTWASEFESTIEASEQEIQFQFLVNEEFLFRRQRRFLFWKHMRARTFSSLRTYLDVGLAHVEALETLQNSILTLDDVTAMKVIKATQTPSVWAIQPTTLVQNLEDSVSESSDVAPPVGLERDVTSDKIPTNFKIPARPRSRWTNRSESNNTDSPEQPPLVNPSDIPLPMDEDIPSTIDDKSKVGDNQSNSDNEGQSIKHLQMMYIFQCHLRIPESRSPSEISAFLSRRNDLLSYISQGLVPKHPYVHKALSGLAAMREKQKDKSKSTEQRKHFQKRGRKFKKRVKVYNEDLRNILVSSVRDSEEYLRAGGELFWAIDYLAWELENPLDVAEAPVQMEREEVEVADVAGETVVGVAGAATEDWEEESVSLAWDYAVDFVHEAAGKGGRRLNRIRCMTPSPLRKCFRALYDESEVIQQVSEARSRFSF